MNTGVACPSANTVAPSTNVTASWAFTYDGDGTRVKQVYTTYVAPTTLVTTYYFFGGIYVCPTGYEVETVGSTTTTTRYYALGGQTVAMYDGANLRYTLRVRCLLTDHLGSVVAVTDANGGLVSQQRFLPFGQLRGTTPIPYGYDVTQTDLGYREASRRDTSQRNIDAQGATYTLGLMDYKARFYSGSLMRFAQPDTIVPGAGNSQAWNRYVYTLGNPFKDSDLTHHILLKAGLIILEGVDLSAVEPGAYALYCLPLKLIGSDGAPARAVLVG
jgi:RHS repeat-associated protein